MPEMDVEKLKRHIDDSAVSMSDDDNPLIQIRLSCLVWLIRYMDLSKFELR